MAWTEHCRADLGRIIAAVEFIAESLVHIDDRSFGGAIIGLAE